MCMFLYAGYVCWIYIFYCMLFASYKYAITPVLYTNQSNLDAGTPLTAHPSPPPPAIPPPAPSGGGSGGGNETS